MMTVTLEIENENDWQVLWPLLERLQVAVRIFPEKLENTTDNQKKRDWEIIMKGIEKPNFEKFVSDFENDRQDRILPFRNQ
jgi:hypothetical protein